MKAISIGTRYEIYNDSLKTYDQLPAKTYIVCYAQSFGFFLVERPDLTVNEKIYGVHLIKANKVIETFKIFERNLGVILSGGKGIGKSLFARLLSSKAVEAGYPVIIVDQFIPGIASYIESIDQEVVFLFDEFDKTFGKVYSGENETDPQSGLLSLFDGVSQGKKLFIITCNKLHKLNDYLINRPGRFHYHFRFNYPSAEEIREYLTDKLGEQYMDEIEKVITFSRKVALNFDCLRAIAFELSLEQSFEAAIQDLNIINTNEETYHVTLHFKGGITMDAKRCRLDLFDNEVMERVSLEDEKGRNRVIVSFNPSACSYDELRHATTIPAAQFTLECTDYFGTEMQEETEKLIPEYLSIVRSTELNIHYSTV